jgi:UDP-3-O-[3-hydroxymyristoyl] glucosamine N-acyltransferase
VVGSEGFGFVPTANGWRKMPQTGQVVLEERVEVGCGSTIDRPSVGETRIGAGTKIDNLVHIGHGVSTGKDCALAAQVGIAGGARLGNGVILAGQVGLANKAVMGDQAIASSKSGVHGEVAAGEVVSGYPAIPNRLWLRSSAVFNKLPELAKALRQLEKQAKP